MRIVAYAALAALYSGAVLFLLAESSSWGSPILIAAAGAVVAVVVVVTVGVVTRRRAAGSDRIRHDVDLWIRTRELPDTVPLGTSLPLIAERISRIQRQLWSSSVLLGIWTVQLLLQSFDGPGSAMKVAFFVLIVAAAAGLFAWAVYHRVRVVPILRKLLTDGQRRLATAPALDDER